MIIFDQIIALVAQVGGNAKWFVQRNIYVANASGFQGANADIAYTLDGVNWLAAKGLDLTTTALITSVQTPLLAQQAAQIMQMQADATTAKAASDAAAANANAAAQTAAATAATTIAGLTSQLAATQQATTTAQTQLANAQATIVGLQRAISTFQEQPQ